ncbi:hypothetical protein BKI52_03925 [marine bacterium AO1-C]|nr:hypothetical protein BKI52_03925 [marine bacterium AO1-C]
MQIDLKKVLQLSGSLAFRIIFLYLCMFSCSSKKQTNTQSPAIQQMAQEFLGEYGIDFIRKEVNAAFKVYEVPQTEANYQRCADELTRLRKASKNSVSEMDILSHVKALNARAYGVSFFKQLSASAKYLENNSLDLPS